MAETAAPAPGASSAMSSRRTDRRSQWRALDRIGALFEIERMSIGKIPDERCGARRQKAVRLLAALASRLDEQIIRTTAYRPDKISVASMAMAPGRRACAASKSGSTRQRPRRGPISLHLRGVPPRLLDTEWQASIDWLF